MTEIEQLQDDVKRLSEHVSNLQRAVLWLCQDVDRSGYNLEIARVQTLVAHEVSDGGQRYRVPRNESPCEGPDEASPSPRVADPIQTVHVASSPERAERIAAAAREHPLVVGAVVRGALVIVDFKTTSYDEASAAEVEYITASLRTK